MWHSLRHWHSALEPDRSDSEYEVNMLAIYAWAVGFICTVWILYWTLKHVVPVRLVLRGALASDAYFLFDGSRLVKASRTGRQLLTATENGVKDWAGFHACFGSRFGKLPQISPDIATHKDAVLKSADGAILRLQAVGRYLRMTLVEADDDANCFAAHRLFLITKQMSQLHNMCHNLPYVIWQTTAEGGLIWQNQAYLSLRDDVGGHTAHSLFDLILSKDQTTVKNRQSLHLSFQKKTNWYDIISIWSQNVWTHSAVNINEIIKAETAQRNFVQTLGKTFAEMSIGLAVFDQNHRLVLFNPALIDLTSLGAGFLSERPILTHFFNQLRENRIIPEPRNSTAWCQQLKELVSRSNEGAYCATWMLSNGLTYRVRGRPHPNGALAFLFENISAEISLTRKFRTKLDGLGTIIQNLEPALIVFDSLGQIRLSNQAYAALWADTEAAATNVQGRSIIEVSRSWQATCQPTPVWGDLRDYAITLEGRDRWTALVTRESGDTLHCAISPLPDNGTMVCFQVSGTSQM